MSLILHITTRSVWQQAQNANVYEGDTLHTEGFIHCSTPNQVIAVANARFCGQKELVLLCIDTEKVQADIIYENLEGGEQLFPHIYGRLNTDAVIEALDFAPVENGMFRLPEGVLALLSDIE